MPGRQRLDALTHFIHEHYLWFIVASYVLAALWPAPGLWLRGVSFGTVTVFGATTHLSLPTLLLALLLFNAGLGIRAAHLHQLLRNPWPLAAGLAGNLLVPIAFIALVSQTLQLWHNPDEVQNVLVGLALVVSMPVAGSSTAWSQNANGDLALSLGLVVGSTLLSPLTTPVALHSVAFMTTGDYSEDLHELAATGTNAFLAVSVILPSLLGMAGHGLLGETRVAAAKPLLKVLNLLNLLLLNYSNASVALPQTLANPDYDFLALILGIVISLCVLAFASGWLLARMCRRERSQTIALTFGLGMNNNGTGLVLATMALADHPLVLLPIIGYNLVQHLVAGFVDAVYCTQPDYG